MMMPIFLMVGKRLCYIASVGTQQLECITQLRYSVCVPGWETSKETLTEAYGELN